MMQMLGSLLKIPLFNKVGRVNLSAPIL